MRRDCPPQGPAGRTRWVIAQLHAHDLSCGILARTEGVSKQAISHAIRYPSSHLEQVIAGAIGMTARELFPERFDALGGRRVRVNPPARTRRELFPERFDALGGKRGRAYPPVRTRELSPERFDALGGKRGRAYPPVRTGRKTCG